jgi:putative flippase GtrA
MAGPDRTPSTASAGSQLPLERYLRYGAVWAVAAGPAFAVLAALWLYPAQFAGIGEVSLGAFALMFPLAVRELRVERRTEFVYFLLIAGTAFAVVSILTGAANGLTDQPFTTPQYAATIVHGPDPYVSPLVVHYQQYGQSFSFRSVYLFLPLLTFLQVPGVSYKWVALAGWVALVLVARRRFDAAIMLGQPYVVIVAANGYNDLVVLFLLTLGFVGWEGRRQEWAEWLALGCKQFANLFVVAYYAIRREWGKLAVTLGVTVAFLLPFLLWSGPAVLCPAVFSDWHASCGGGFRPSFQLDYSVWVVWGLGLFYSPLLGVIRRRSATGGLARLLRSAHLSFDDLLRIPAFLVVGVSGVFVNLSVFVLLGLRLGSTVGALYLASAGAFLVALCWNFLWNRAWAFAGRGGRSTAYHLGLYGVIQAGVLGVNEAVLGAAVRFGASNVEGQVIGIIAGSALGYTANLRWNFRPLGPEAPSA